MWAEQLAPLLQAGFRVLQVDMRGHGGSDPVTGNYTMKALAGDVAPSARCAVTSPRALYRPVDRRHDRPGFCDRARRQADLSPLERHATVKPRNAAALWDERMNTVRRANSPEPLADGTVERWFTDAFKPRKPGRWKQIRDTVAATTPPDTSAARQRS